MTRQYQGYGKLKFGDQEAECEFDFTVFELNGRRSAQGDVTADFRAIHEAAGRSDVTLTMNDGKVLKVLVGSYSITGDPRAVAELLINTPI